MFSKSLINREMKDNNNKLKMIKIFKKIFIIYNYN